MKPKLLVVELWGLGDLVIATPFIRAAQEKYEVTLLAKPYAEDLQRRLWGDVQVVPFIAPWTAFKHKYRLWTWPLRQILRLRRQLEARHFEFGLSARWDPRDHLLLHALGVKSRLGFPRLGSQVVLTQPLQRPEPQSHRYEYWRVLAQALGFEVTPREQLDLPHNHPEAPVLVHTGAGQAVRVWPLERYQELVRRLRASGRGVHIACDPDQQDWWRSVGEPAVTVPRSVAELLAVVDRSSAFIGNDSGPGHLAAFCGVPTFTLFGPQLPEWFAPLHPAAETLEGKACPYKPCSDYCRFAAPCCMTNQEVEEVWQRVHAFLGRLNVLAAPKPA